MISDIHTVNICCYLVTENIKNIKIDNYHDGFMWVDLNHAKNLNLDNAVLKPLLLGLNCN